MSPRHPRRPPRLERQFESIPPLFFLTFNTWRRVHLLARDEVHEAFRIFCQRAETQFHVAVGRYVLMPDHVHLFAHFPTEGISLESWVQSLRSVLGKQILALGTPKPHWQEGFFDHLLRSDESYAQKWEYVRQNPVRAGLCRAPGDWRFQGEIVQFQR